MQGNASGIEAIVRVMEYIEVHIEDSPTLEQLSAVAGYSPYYFVRMFSFAVGYSPIEHLRRRKLWHAAARLKGGEAILDVALRYGFQSHEGFTRAFTRQFKMPPSRYRLRGSGIIPPVPYPTYIEGGFHMQPVFVTRSDTDTIGFLLRTTPQSPEIPAHWEKVMKDGSFECLMKKSAKMENFGICIMPKDDDEGLDYLIAFDYDGKSEIDGDMTQISLPGGLFAVFHAPDHTAIRETWTHAYTQWLPESGYEFDSPRYDFELYPDGKSCDVYIPVRKK